jgi:hypothetical protein
MDGCEHCVWILAFKRADLSRKLPASGCLAMHHRLHTRAGGNCCAPALWTRPVEIIPNEHDALIPAQGGGFAGGRRPLAPCETVLSRSCCCFRVHWHT